MLYTFRNRCNLRKFVYIVFHQRLIRLKDLTLHEIFLTGVYRVVRNKKNDFYEITKCKQLL